jgi:hypothetical protein
VNPGDSDHGTGLVRRVIDALRTGSTDARLLRGNPTPLTPEVLAAITFPSGRPLPPSLRQWLEFDTGMIIGAGWLPASEAASLTPRPLDAIATAEWGADWGAFYAPLAERFSECFLLPGGTDSRRVLATGEPDEYGEYPVFAIDIDDLPYVGLMYPGFDVYLADTAGLIDRGGGGYDSLVDHPVYGDRMRQHARRWFDGHTSSEYPWPR